ncbi:DUF695 domain-containing protein [Barrientosiimonas humi]|uniref:DUF695 domain-containing protein n=1 Tax=Barrientosiimonas humi TaxID=999931 RepID=UPI00370D6924
MGIFGRGKGQGRSEARRRQAGAIQDFWQWWQESGSRDWANLVGEGTIPDAAVEDLSGRVHAIDPGLSWETAAGSESMHVLVVSPEGDPELRAVARRWRDAAPEADLVWSYADSRPPVADPQDHALVIDERRFEGGQVVVGVQRRGSRVDVVLHHPLFPEVPEQVRTQVMFLMLDVTLGEQQTETWIGELTASEVPPLDGFGLTGLRAVVRDLAAEFTTDTGEPAWALMEGNGPMGPVLAAAEVPLAAAMNPALSEHVLVEAAYGHRNEAGLPLDPSLTELRDLEAELRRAAGPDGRVVAHESSAGVRRLHLYVDPATDAVPRIEQAVRGWGGTARVRTDDDPGWAEVAHLRG